MKFILCLCVVIGLKDAMGFNFGSGAKSAVTELVSDTTPLEPELPMKKSDPNFLRVQMMAIQAYKKTKPHKSWNCSYDEHTKLLSQIPHINPVEKQDIFAAVQVSMHANKGNVLSGAEAVANASWRGEIDLLLIWDSVFVNTLCYYNVFYGGYTYKYVGLGTKYPDSYFHISDELLFFDLHSCLPFIDFLYSGREKNIREIMRVPADEQVPIRNAVGGILGLVTFPLKRDNNLEDGFINEPEKMDNSDVSVEQPDANETPL